MVLEAHSLAPCIRNATKGQEDGTKAVKCMVYCWRKILCECHIELDFVRRYEPINALSKFGIIQLSS